MDISVVIPTRNRAESLNTLLNSIKEQLYDQDKYEVIVIDNGSTDGTNKVCGIWQKEILHFKYIYDDNPGLHTGRNRGYQESVSDIIVYADDDIIPLPTWLGAIVKGFERDDVVLIGGNDIPQFEIPPSAWVEDLWREEDGIKVLFDYSCILCGGREREIPPYYVLGCNFAIRKSILDETHGFHPDGMPDNLIRFRGDGENGVSSYIMNKKLTAIFVPEASVYHVVGKERLREEYIYKIAYRTGVSDAYMLLRSKAVADKWKLVKVILRGLKTILIGRNDSMRNKKQIMIAKGMMYELKECLFSKSLRDWVKREDYLGENGIIPNGRKKNRN